MVTVFKLNARNGLPPYSVGKFINGTFIYSAPFAPANTDYQQFKLDITNGAELQDAEGHVMTAEQVQDFLETLP